MARSSKSKHTVTVASAEGLSASDARPTCAIYNRVSTEVGQDPTLAMDDLRRAATMRGYRIVMEVAETGSGKRNDRPGLKTVLDAARKGQVSAVLVVRLDRFSRSLTDLRANVTALNSWGVRFVCTEQAIDIGPNGDAMGQLTLSILGAVAEFEHGIITERVREGVRRARARGVQFGRPRVGDVDTDDVRRLRDAGRSWSEVADKLGCSVALARRRFAE